MRWLVEHSLRLRVLVAFMAAALLVGGFFAAQNTPVDVFPEFAPPRVEVQTEAPGLSSVEVEELISSPLEHAVNGTPGLRVVRSKSVLGLSSVVMLFEEGTDLLRVRQLVQERLARVAPSLPVAARAPVVLQPLSTLSRALKVGISSDTLSQMELTDLIRWVVRPKLLAVPGVANVAVWGQRDREVQVRVSPEILRARGVRLDDVTRAAREAVEPAAGGFVDTPTQRMPVTHTASAGTIAELAEAPVAAFGRGPLRLGDVATLVEAPPPPIGDAVIDDRSGILLIVEKQPDANTLEVTRGVESALDALRPALRGVRVDPTVFRPASFIERAVRNLREALAFGCLLVVVILASFLFEWRTAVISALAIPLSLAVAAVALHLRGGTLDTMALAGLAIALGEVVDDAIIDVENILRRLRENAADGSRRSAFTVVLEASVEVRSAVVFATLVVVMVFIPVLALDGIAGSFFRPLATAYVVAVSASLAVALVVTPALCLLLLPAAPRESRAPLAAWCVARYRAVLPWVIDRPRLVGATAAVLMAASAVAATGFGETFMPEFHETDFLMHWVAPPGTSLEAVRRTAERASRELRAIPGVRNFGSHIGRAEVADEVVGPNFAELWISLDPNVDYAVARARIERAVDGYPGLYRDVQTYLQERVKEVISGASGAIVVRIYGPTLPSLRAEAARVGSALRGIAGVVDLKVEPQVLVPQVEVRVRPEALLRHGITAGEVRRAATTLLQGQRVGQIVRASQVIDVVVRADEALRADVTALRDLRVETRGGAMVPLGELADVRITATPNVIQHEATARRIDVTCNVRGRDLGAVARDIGARLAAITLPPAHHVDVLGEYAARQSARRRLGIYGLLALLGVFAVLYADFRSLTLAAMAFATLPFALVGGVASAWITDRNLSLGTLVGFVTLLGISARNGIMLVSQWRHLEEAAPTLTERERVVRGAEERVVPIAMTALATGLALVPIIAGGNRPGHEIEYPMAVVIVGGLVSSTALNLLVLPALYLRVRARR